MQIQFDPTISLGTIGSLVVFAGGAGWIIFKLGIYAASIRSLLGKFERFMEESTRDRKDLRQKVEANELRVVEMHEENSGNFALVFKALRIAKPGRGYRKPP